MENSGHKQSGELIFSPSVSDLVMTFVVLCLPLMVGFFLYKSSSPSVYQNNNYSYRVKSEGVALHCMRDCDPNEIGCWDRPALLESANTEVVRIQQVRYGLNGEYTENVFQLNPGQRLDVRCEGYGYYIYNPQGVMIGFLR